MDINLFPEMDSDEHAPSKKNKVFPLRISLRDHNMLEELVEVTGKKKNLIMVESISHLFIKVFSLQISHTVVDNQDDEYTMILQIRLNTMQRDKLERLSQNLGFDKSIILRSSLHEKYKSVIQDGPGALFG